MTSKDALREIRYVLNNTVALEQTKGEAIRAIMMIYKEEKNVRIEGTSQSTQVAKS